MKGYIIEEVDEDEYYCLFLFGMVYFLRGEFYMVMEWFSIGKFYFVFVK